MFIDTAEARESDPIGNNVKSGLPKVLQQFLFFYLFLLGCSVASVLVCRYALRLGYPYNSPLLNEHFPDLLNLKPRFRSIHTLLFLTSTTVAPLSYPAPVALLYSFFFLFQHTVRAYLAFSLGAFSIAAIWFARLLVRRGLSPRSTVLLIGAVSLTSYPLAFVCRQANMEICIWVFLSLAVFCVCTERTYTAAALIGIAGAMKIFPFIYFGLLFSRREYKQIAFGVLIAVCVTLASLWFVYPHIAESWRLTQVNIARFKPDVVTKILPNTGFDHSLFGLIKRSIRPAQPPKVLDLLLRFYLPAIAVIGTVLYFFRIRHLPIANQILCLTTASILFPPTSFDYTLMHLYAPWSVLVLLALRYAAQSKRVRGLTMALFCLAILLAPETELIVHIRTPTSVGGQIKAIALLALFVVGIWFPFRDEEISDSQAGQSSKKPDIHQRESAI